MNIKVLLYLCSNNKFDLLEEVLLENKEDLNKKIILKKEFLIDVLDNRYYDEGSILDKNFNSIIDCLAWISIVNNKKEVTKFLLNLDFFDYKLMQNTFFIACCNEDFDILNKLIENGFDYKIDDFKYGKDDKNRSCSCLDSALMGSLCRSKENSINFLIDLPNVTIYDFEVSIISITIFKRKDILNKLITSTQDAINYINFLENITEYNYKEDIKYIKSLYNI